MIWEGCLDGVDEVYGWHNWPAWPMGSLRVQAGPVMAHTVMFSIVLTGRGGHGSQPHACVDPIVCGAAVVTALQTIVSRSIPSFSNAVVTVGQFHAGERDNVIPETAKISGTIRDCDIKIFSTIEKRFKEIVTGVAKGYGCSAEVELMTIYPVLNNHAAQVEAVERCAKRLAKPIAVELSKEGLPLMGGEDFSFYTKEKPGCFFFLGTQELLVQNLATYEGGEEQPRTNCICHGITFDFNDNVLLRAVTMFVRIVEDRFALELYSQEEIFAPPFDLVNNNGEPDAKRQKTTA